MLRSPARPRRLSASVAWLGRWVALIALAVQLAAAASVPAPAAVLDAALGAPICHSGGTAAGHDAPAAPHPASCVQCPLCQVAAQAGVTLPAAPAALPPPPFVAVRAEALAQPRAPPLRQPLAAVFPTGPPATV